MLQIPRSQRVCNGAIFELPTRWIMLLARNLHHVYSRIFAFQRVKWCSLRTLRSSDRTQNFIPLALPTDYPPGGKLK